MTSEDYKRGLRDALQAVRDTTGPGSGSIPQETIEMTDARAKVDGMHPYEVMARATVAATKTGIIRKIERMLEESGDG